MLCSHTSRTVQSWMAIAVMRMAMTLKKGVDSLCTGDVTDYGLKFLKRQPDVIKLLLQKLLQAQDVGRQISDQEWPETNPAAVVCGLMIAFNVRDDSRAYALDFSYFKEFVRTVYERYSDQFGILGDYGSVKFETYCPNDPSPVLPPNYCAVPLPGK
eukprot:GHVS01072299.1.p1 GENE.GHVS01072299.1~~GHVS01072299.1.p1  ORF type:complete len:157 (+),score=4.64 GHVS01072299.1:63-533(+)